MKKRLKVLQIQYKTGRSGDFVRRLQEQLIQRHIDSKLLSLYSEVVDTKRLNSMGTREKLTHKINNRVEQYLLRNYKAKHGKFSYTVTGTDVSDHELVKEADVIYIHWALNGFLSIDSFEKIAKLGKPVIFIMHDMWNITGGCHHSFECNKYQTNCHACYMFDPPKQKDLAYRQFQKKLKFYSKYDNLVFVSPSSWLYECALSSGLMKGKKVVHIPNVLDRKLFKPFGQEAARSILNVEEDKIVIAFGAVSVTNPYKGWKYLDEALNKIKQTTIADKVKLLIFGEITDQKILDGIPMDYKILGWIKDEHKMALIYNAADVFVAPSLADNLPYTVFESLSCGTPVTAFDVGGIPDMIKHQSNGYLAEYKNADDLVAGIQYCLAQKLTGYVPEEMDNDLSIDKHLKIIREFGIDV